MTDDAFARRRAALLQGYGVLPQPAGAAGEDYGRDRAGAFENELEAPRESKVYRMGRSLARAVRAARRVLRP
jgi:hypothetical protein